MRRRKSTFAGWPGLAVQSALMALEAQQVIALRLQKLAMGRGAQREATRMVTEKLQAFAASGQLLANAALRGKADTAPKKIVARYHRTVRANRRRLSK